ncbi:MAG: REP-associated tyrosine transposase [Bacteroidales bacterium]
MEEYILFFTASVHNWNLLLENEKYKKIILESLKFLTENERIFLYGFVIMPNHIHLVWKIKEGHKLQNVQRDFLKYTAQIIKYDLRETNPSFLERFRKSGKDRHYQFWQRNSFNKRIFNRTVLEQKLNYIHNNPLQDKWKLVEKPEDYEYSSARYYMRNEDQWGILTHYYEHIF